MAWPSALGGSLIPSAYPACTVVAATFCISHGGWRERLIALADAGLTSAEAEHAAWADVERIEAQLETATVNLVEILRENLGEMLQAIDDADDPPHPEAIAETLDDAMTAAVGSEEVATKIRRPHLAQPLLERAHAAKTRIEELRARLVALP